MYQVMSTIVDLFSALIQRENCANVNIFKPGKYAKRN